MAYKQDIDDYRESPALKVISEFKKAESNIDYYDPYIPSYKTNDNVVYSISALTPEIISLYDLVVVTTAHTNIDYDMVAEYSQIVFDTKNAMKNVLNREKIELI